jgi:hypothetical protein
VKVRVAPLRRPEDVVERVPEERRDADVLHVLERLRDRFLEPLDELRDLGHLLVRLGELRRAALERLEDPDDRGEVAGDVQRVEPVKLLFRGVDRVLQRDHPRHRHRGQVRVQLRFEPRDEDRLQVFGDLDEDRRDFRLVRERELLGVGHLGRERRGVQVAGRVVVARPRERKLVGPVLAPFLVVFLREGRKRAGTRDRENAVSHEASSTQQPARPGYRHAV